MAFEEIEAVRLKASGAPAVPPDGISMRACRVAKRNGGHNRYLRLTIGEKLARGISLTQPEHGVRLLFGTDRDAGMVRVSVDNDGGRFRAKRTKLGGYFLTINAATADGLFALDFPAFTRGGLEALRPQNGQPPHFVFKASPEMLKVEE